MGKHLFTTIKKFIDIVITEFVCITKSLFIAAETLVFY